VATSAASLLLVAAVLAAIVGWLIGTTSGMYAVISLANRFAPVTIDTRGGFGSLAGGFGFAEVRVAASNTAVSATTFRATLREWHWEPLRFDFAHLSAATLRVEVTTDERNPTPVSDIGIPLRLSTDELALGELTVAVDGKPFSLHSLAGRVTVGPDGYRVESGHVAYQTLHADFAGSLGAPRPFALLIDGRVATEVRDKAVSAVARVRGSLVEMSVEGELYGAARGRAAAVVASFAKPALKSLSLDLVGVDPRTWHPAAPRGDLALKAELVPNETMDRIAGSVSVSNAAPGTIDAERIPARSATALVSIDATGIRLDRIAAQLLQGTLAGEFTLDWEEARWQANARVADVDPGRLHGALRPLRVDGQLQARQAGGTYFVNADLAHRGQPQATLAFDGRFTPTLATINSARLELGDGFAALSGSFEMAGAYRADLRGELQRFEPGRLVKGIDARLNGRMTVDGVLRPRAAGRVRLELAESRAWGRPLAGLARLEVDGAQRFDIDLDLAVRSAHLVAKGGLGAPDRTIEVKLDVPALAELLPSRKAAVAGALTLTATARGQWQAPQFEARLAGRNLRYGDHSLASADVEANYGGGSDGPLRVLSGFAGYAYTPQPRATVQMLSLSVDGRLSSHAARLMATIDNSHGAVLLADGGWRDETWRGRVREATIGPPLDLRLLVPADLVAGAHGVEFGPAQFAVQNVRVSDLSFRAGDSGLYTQGSFNGLQPTRFAPPAEGPLAVAATPAAERAPLSLRGEWELRLAGDTADGHLRIERSGGDLYAGRGPDSALGLTDTWLEARIEANRLEASTRIEGLRGGGLGAHLEATIENSPDVGWRLAPARPWLINGAFDLATMDWVNALLSDRLRANVRLGGRLASTVRIEGTPANPSASGRLVGEALRVAWIEQGVRLENGRLLAHLQDDVLVLDELHFSGPPRVRPDDRRAAAALKEEQEGSLSANGRLKLGDLSGVIQVAASKLPVLQRPDRWVIASGGGNIEATANHIQLNGAFAADAGFVGFGRSELPSLSSDVVVIEAGLPTESRAPRFTLGFDLGVDLGSAFFLTGKGLSTRVEGAVRLRSAGRGAVTATGTLAAVDGVYQGFGQRLKIERGRLNFQGPPENPGLDILALRTGLPVEVGVTITRTAAAPLVRLHSDPPMTDAEALSWLVLGRAPDQQGRGENLALAQAAASLLAGGEGSPTRVARAIGFDEIIISSGNRGIASLLPARGVAGSLRSDESSAATVAGEVITIVKNINDSLTVSYQQAISDTSRFLQLNYQLSQRLSAVVRGGTDNAIDLVYTIAFD